MLWEKIPEKYRARKFTVSVLLFVGSLAAGHAELAVLVSRAYILLEGAIDFAKTGGPRQPSPWSSRKLWHALVAGGTAYFTGDLTGAVHTVGEWMGVEALIDLKAGRKAKAR